LDLYGHILALLSDGPRSFTGLADTLVPRVCARGTLSKHLKDLVKDGTIERELFDDRTTLYRLMLKSVDRARSARDTLTLELLVNELEHKTRKELTLETVKAQENKWIDLARAIGPTKDRPKMNFCLQLDESTLRVVNLIQSSSKLASELQGLIRRKLNEIKEKMPATVQDELQEFFSGAKDWHDIKDFSTKMALKHGLRFLVFSWYDGGGYKRRILSAIRNMEKLERSHEEDIAFLNELNRRCFYSTLEHYYDPYEDILEGLISRLLRLSDLYQLLEDAFWLYFHKECELMLLEAALISSSASARLPPDALKEKLRYGAKEIRCPYSIISAAAYARMKLRLLSEGERRFLIRDLLNWLTTEAVAKLFLLYSSDFRSHPDDYRLAIDLLSEKLGANEKMKDQIQSPIMNFQFSDGNKTIDFSGEPIVENFFKFRKDRRKRKWLQKCLLLGLPIFSNIPLEKLGFEVTNIL